MTSLKIDQYNYVVLVFKYMLKALYKNLALMKFPNPLFLFYFNWYA